MNKIKRASRVIRIAFQIAFIVLPILLVLFWIYAPNHIVIPGSGVSFSFIPEGTLIMHALTISNRIWGFLITAISTSVSLLMIYYVIKLFKLYESGTIFSLQNVKCIKRAGGLLMISQVITQLCNTLLTLILTWGNPPHHQMLELTFSGGNIGLVLVGLMVLVVGWVMTEAVKLRHEQELTV